MSERQRQVFMPKKETWTYQFLMNVFILTGLVLFCVFSGLLVAAMFWVGDKIGNYIDTSSVWASIVAFFASLPFWLNAGMVVVVGIIFLAAILTIYNREPY